MYITTDMVKKHLNIDADFSEDDQYISDLIEVAEDALPQHLDIALSELEDEEGNLPSSITHALLLMVSNLYANREPVAYTTTSKVPYTYEYLIGLYKQYYVP